VAALACGMVRFAVPDDYVTQANISILLALTSNELVRHHVTFTLQINNR
jgi:hypothetical protein